MRAWAVALIGFPLLIAFAILVSPVPAIIGAAVLGIICGALDAS